MSDERVLNVTEFLASWRNKNIRSYLEELGWQHVPEIDGTYVKDFSEFREKLCGEMTDFMKDGWFVKPVAITNQDLFHINELFMKEIRACSTRKEVETFCRKFPIKRRRRLRPQITCSDKVFQNTSKGWTLPMSGLVDFTLPENVEVTATDAIITLGLWFTEAHVEEGGDDSVSFTPLGVKSFLIAERGMASLNLFKDIQSVQSFVRFLERGPQNNADQKIKFFVSKETSILMQPALSCHSVLTLSEGPSLVTGWEGQLMGDCQRKSQLLNTFCPGLGTSHRRFLLENTTLQQSVCLLENKDERSEVVCQLSAIDARGLPSATTSRRGRPKISKKWKRTANLPNGRRGLLTARENEKGIPFFSKGFLQF